MARREKIYSMIIAGCSLVSCSKHSSSSGDGTNGTSARTGNDFWASRADVTGSLTSQSGNQSALQNWVVALIEQDTNIGRVAMADGTGTLKFSKVSSAAIHTAILLSPDFLVQAVMSLPSPTAKTIRQFFSLGTNVLPPLIQQGSIITMSNTDTISITNDFATDSGGTGTPDGTAAFSLVDESSDIPYVKSVALDGTSSSASSPKNSAAEIDGDGLINVIDADMDGDGTLDVFDTDANGNGVTDSQERISSQHFKPGLEYISAQWDNVPDSTGTTLTSTIKFVAKVRTGVTASAVKVRGASTFFKNSTYTGNDGSTGTWDFTLADDGNSSDGASGDGLYARKVTLASGIAPRKNQIIFIQLVIGTGTDQWTAEYPYMFPPLTAALITASYDSSTRNITLSGDPFGATYQGFGWLADVYNSDGTRIYESPTTTGSNRTLTLPANILQSGQTYTYEVIAQTQDKVPGYPNATVHTTKGTISN